MRILLANQIYAFGNHGDDVLLDVAFSRLSQAWPDAVFQVVTDVPSDLLSRYPGAQPISPASFRAWRDFKHQNLLGRVHPPMPRAASRRVLALESAIRLALPSLTRLILEAKSRLRGISLPDVRAYAETLLGADLVIVIGGGHFMKGYEHHALNLLQVLQAASANGTPTAMLSQGLLPIAHSELSAQMEAVLPHVGLITLREGLDGPSILNVCGAQTNFMVTGDDAIEVAYAARSIELGTGIGVCMRLAPYSEVNASCLVSVRSALLDAAQRYRVPLLPVPISFKSGESDVAAMRQLLAGTPITDHGAEVDTPHKAIQQIGRCRVVVAGSYHAGVFALAQGIPVVGLARSAYYLHKFSGLADQFGSGCQVVLMDDPRFKEILSEAIEKAWGSAEHVRGALLEAAVRQIKAGHAAYDRIRELVTSSAAVAGPELARQQRLSWNR